MASAEAVLGFAEITLATPEPAALLARYATLLGAAPEGDRFALANTVLRIVAGEVPALVRLAFAVADPARHAALLARRGLPFEAGTLAPEAARGLPLALAVPGGADPGCATRLDHLVVRSADPERSLALFGGRLGLELRLDRSAPQWGTRFLFFRCGDAVLEVTHALAEGVSDRPDQLWGLTWGVADIAAQHGRLEAAGIPVSPLRTGRKPGTRIFTVREGAAGVPTAFIGA